MSARGIETHGKHLYVDGRYLILGSESAADLITWLEIIDNEVTELGGKIDILETRVDKLVWEKVADITVESPETVITVEGLDLEADEPYNIILTLVNPTDGFLVYSLYFNGDHEDTHYWRQFISAVDDVITSGRRNDPRITGIEAGESALVEATLARSPDGLVRCSVSVNRRAPAEIMALTHKLVWTVPENVTIIEVEADVDGGVGADSRLVLLKMG